MLLPIVVSVVDTKMLGVSNIGIVNIIKLIKKGGLNIWVL